MLQALWEAICHPFSVTWLFLMNFSWEKAGGSSFVEVSIGINLAFVAWEKYRSNLEVFNRKTEQIVSVATANALDGTQKQRVGQFFIWLSRKSREVHRLFLLFTFTCAWSAIISAIYMLYSDRFCGHDWLLISPTVIYVVLSFFTYLIILLPARFVNWCCKEVVTGEIDELSARFEPKEESDPPEAPKPPPRKRATKRASGGKNGDK